MQAVQHTYYVRGRYGFHATISVSQASGAMPLVASAEDGHLTEGQFRRGLDKVLPQYQWVTRQERGYFYGVGQAT